MQTFFYGYMGCGLHLPPSSCAHFPIFHTQIFQNRYMGCGPISTDLLKGLDVVDLGSGYARNTYAYGRLVGEAGTSIGVELTKVEVR